MLRGRVGVAPTHSTPLHSTPLHSFTTCTGTSAFRCGHASSPPALHASSSSYTGSAEPSPTPHASLKHGTISDSISHPLLTSTCSPTPPYFEISFQKKRNLPSPRPTASRSVNSFPPHSPYWACACMSGVCTLSSSYRLADSVYSHTTPFCLCSFRPAYLVYLFIAETRSPALQPTLFPPLLVCMK